MKEHSRRNFLKVMGSATAAAGAASLGSIGLAQADSHAPTAKSFAGTEVPFTGPKKKVNVYSEDGELKEVVFGRLDTFRLPKYDPIFDFAGKRMTDLLKKADARLFKDADPQWFADVDDQMKRVVAFLESRGIIVHRPQVPTFDMLNSYEASSKLNIDLYARDGIVSVGDSLFEGSFMTPERSRNKHTQRALTMELMRNGTVIKSVPQPLDTYNHDFDLSPLLEGGDVLIDHGNIYVGNSGVATNELGVLWLRNAYPDWNVHEIKIKTDRFPHQHLDCVMVAFKEWGVILEEDIVGGIAGLPESLRRKQWVSMTLEEAKDKLGNFIALSPNEIVMATEAQRLREAIQKARPELKIHHFPYYEVGKIGGSIRCNTQPIFRVG